MGHTTDLGLVMTIVASVALGVTTVAVLLRSYVRLFLTKRFSADDYLIWFSQVNFCAFMYCILHEAKYGTGKHLVDVLAHNPGDVPTTLKYWWISQHFFIFATCTVKISVALFFLSLCPPRNLRIIAITTACVSVVTGIATEAFQIFQCWPVSYFWNRAIPGHEGSCFDRYKAVGILQTVNTFDILTDVILAALPCVLVWNLRMQRIKKFGVSILLGLGGLPAIAAIIRACYFKQMLNPNDFTYTVWPISMTSAAEPAIAITVVCAAHLRPMMRQVFPSRWFSISEPSGASDDMVTFGRLGGRSKSVAEIEFDERLKPGTYSQRPAEWKHVQ